MRLSIANATSSEIKSAGHGMEIHWCIAATPFGNCFLAKTPRGISHFSFFDDDETESLEVLANDWPKASLKRDDKLAESTVQLIFKDNAPMQLYLRGTEFQLKVWKALIEMPRGQLSTYGQLAKSIGVSGSARAVGNAVGRNRISYLIPCHRVIRQNGEIGGYRWGTVRKRKLIAHEGATLL